MSLHTEKASTLKKNMFLHSKVKSLHQRLFQQFLKLNLPTFKVSSASVAKASRYKNTRYTILGLQTNKGQQIGVMPFGLHIFKLLYKRCEVWKEGSSSKQLKKVI